MPKVLIYPSLELPIHIKYQLLAFIRVQWAEVFQGKNRLWDFVTKDTHPVNVVLMEQDILISHAEVNWRRLDHAGETYKIYGVSAVFTFPSFRNQGYAGQVMAAATHYIQQQDGDLAILFCKPHLRDFYAACGWNVIENNILYGVPTQPQQREHGFYLALFLSEKGSQARAAFETQPLYVGEYTW